MGGMGGDRRGTWRTAGALLTLTSPPAPRRAAVLSLSPQPTESPQFLSQLGRAEERGAACPLTSLPLPGSQGAMGRGRPGLGAATVTAEIASQAANRPRPGTGSGKRWSLSPPGGGAFAQAPKWPGLSDPASHVRQRGGPALGRKVLSRGTWCLGVWVPSVWDATASGHPRLSVCLPLMRQSQPGSVPRRAGRGQGAGVTAAGAPQCHSACVQRVPDLTHEPCAPSTVGEVGHSDSGGTELLQGRGGGGTHTPQTVQSAAAQGPGNLSR